MPKDQRLYMTFPIDFWMHPKIAPLTDSAFRAFVEINGFSRMQDLDGRIPVVTARKMWKPRAIAQLLANHPERPSLSVDGDDYVIWNYDEHQMTRADREALSTKNAENGRKGGRPPKAKPTETQSVSAGNPNETQLKAESESESELKISDTYLLDPVSLELDAREFTAEEIEGFRKALDGFCELDELGTATLVTLLMEASPRPVANVVGYVVRCIQRSPEKVKSLAVEADRQAARVRMEVAS